MDEFNYNNSSYIDVGIANVTHLPVSAWIACAGLGFSLSFLFFMDQNITSAIVNNPQNK